MDKKISRSVVAEKERMLSDAESVRRAKKAVELELEKRKALDLPIAVFDQKEGKVYACYPDGTKVVMSETNER